MTATNHSPQPHTQALDLQAIGLRVRRLLGDVGLDGTAFAARVGVPYGTMRSYLSGSRAPSAEFMAGCYIAFGVMPGWLLTGLGPDLWDQAKSGLGLTAASRPMMAIAYVAEEALPAWQAASTPTRTAGHDDTHIRGVNKQPGVSEAPANALLPHHGTKAVHPLVLSVPTTGTGGGQDHQKIEYQVIPRRLRTAAAGPGTVTDGDKDVIDLAGELAFTFDWLRRNLGTSVGPLSTINVRGDSNAPTLLDGDTIIIDEGIKGVESDGFYVLEVFGRRLVKRVQHLHDGTLVLISDNPAYQRETLARDMARNVLIIGKMVWPRVR